MKTRKIKFWARLGQIAYWIYQYSYMFAERQNPIYTQPILAGTISEYISLVIAFVYGYLVSEAIVRLIGYFAELLEKK